MDEYKEILDYLFTLIPKEEIEKNEPYMYEFCSGFAGFVDTYYYLSKVIPKDWTVIDFGAGYNAQSYFFTDHNKYIAVEPDFGQIEDSGMFCPPNCQIYRMTTKQYIYRVDYPKDKVFAICNYVPKWSDEDSVMLVHNKFRNCYTFYPE